MPVPVDSPAWNDAEENSSIRDQISEFLQQNNETAFHYQELADEILDTSWSEIYQEEQEIQRIGEDQYYDQTDRDDRVSMAKITNTRQDTTLLLAILDDLVHGGEVKRRKVPQSETNIPYEEWDGVSHYTYAGE